jgi:DNA-binding transcriptional LysR family regulator
MELRQLEHFVAVAEERHFSRAAMRVHIVQSGLSSSIRSLERELGTSLFVRSTRRVQLSEAGRALLPEARAALATARRAREAVGAVEGLLRGTLSIGIMQVLDPVDLPGLLGRFSNQHPGVEIRLRQAGASVLVDEVRRGELDLAFVGVPRRDLEGVHATMLADEPMVVACPRDHRLAGRKGLALRDLKDEAFIEFPTDWGVRIAADRTFAAAGISRRIAFELNDVATLLDLVSNGLGIALVPRWVATYERPMALVPLRGRAPRWEVTLATRGDDAMSAAGRALVEMVPLATRGPARIESLRSTAH